MRRITIRDIAKMKSEGEKIPMITAYDYTTASLAEAAEIPIILVGDSLGMVVMGYDSTIPVTLEDMIHHTKMVTRASKRSFVVADLPFMTYQINIDQAMANAARLIQEGGAQGVKLEGGREISSSVNKLVRNGIPVMGHLGLTPQSINTLGGYRIQGRAYEDAENLLLDSLELQNAGVFALVLELVPEQLAAFISEKLSIPTIGIGAGPSCDGQVQVVNDILGLDKTFVPRHAKQYTKLSTIIEEAFISYSTEVKHETFPTDQHSATMDQRVLDQLRAKY